ncbi:5-dehydro-2-deoxygluconokinase [Agromyces sp. NPDC056379]|uniref:5-dehydro-2-deoxygluconokinase n=1 Tax=unclassified Agromyces TaxID=2639701 RepID=UPI0035DFC7BE
MTITTASPFDVITIGRVGIDLYPTRDGVHLEDVDTFTKSVGGSATNVAIAAARHGRRSAVVTRTGDDAFGRYIRRELDGFGVDPRFVGTEPELLTPLTFCEIFPPDDFPITFYRKPKAPDLEITVESLPLDDIRSAAVYWSTVTGLSEEPSRGAHHAAWAARGRRPGTVLDLDYRPMFWSSVDDARREASAALDSVTIAIGNLDECEVAVGERDPYRAADALLDRGVEIAVVKRGPVGVLAKTREETVELPALAVQVVNGLGAGDGFGGAFCHGLLAGWSLERILTFANVAGAIVATRRECSTAMPTSAEVASLAGERGLGGFDGIDPATHEPVTAGAPGARHGRDEGDVDAS